MERKQPFDRMHYNPAAHPEVRAKVKVPRSSRHKLAAARAHRGMIRSAGQKGGLKTKQGASIGR